MTFTNRNDWLVLAGLIFLSAVPVVAGIIRLTILAGGAEITPDNERFFASPLPVVLHIFSSSIYCVLGAFQFSAGLRRRRPGLHRRSGRWLIPCGILAALTGLWMNQFYPFVDGGGWLLYYFRLLFGSAMILSIVLGLVAIRLRDIARHKAWMMRAYAIGLGAGTQAFTHVPWILIFGTPGELSRALLMAAGWIINLAVVEWILRRRPSRKNYSFAAA